MKHLDPQIPTSSSFSVMVDFLWVFFLLAQQSSWRVLSATVQRLPSSSNKSRTSPSIFVSGSGGRCRRTPGPSIFLSQPIHNSHSPAGNSFAPEKPGISGLDRGSELQVLQGGTSDRRSGLRINKCALSQSERHLGIQNHQWHLTLTDKQAALQNTPCPASVLHRVVVFLEARCSVTTYFSL